MIDKIEDPGSAPGDAKKPFVSVVIPVLNGASDIHGCIESLRAQDYPEDCFEIIIVDNGSSDGSAEVVRALGVKCLVRPERGRSRALNTGLSAANGEIICTTDISCRPSPEWISEIVRTFDNPDVGCVAGDIRLLRTVDNAAIRYQEKIDYMSPMSAIMRNRPPFLPYADGANASFRRTVLNEIGPFEESFIKAADVEICYRLLFMTKHKIAFNRRAFVLEPGEESLRALLKQRYRIGIGNVLLKRRFPALYEDMQKRSLRDRYWSMRASARKAVEIAVATLMSVASPAARDRLNEIFISEAMKVAQSLGRRNGARQLSSGLVLPEPIDHAAIDEYIAGRWSAATRIIAPDRT